VDTPESKSEMAVNEKLKGKRIFIIEDNLANRAIMQLLLERVGCQVEFERWGKGATERLIAFAPVDIILLDLMFPANVTGYDVFDMIRLVPEFDHVPIVAVSAAPPEIAIPKTMEKGFSGFICKPIERYELFLQQIVTIMEGTPVWYAG
jgi:CheY-like chemotaxis protein